MSDGVDLVAVIDYGLENARGGGRLSVLLMFVLPVAPPSRCSQVVTSVISPLFLGLLEPLVRTALLAMTPLVFLI